MPNRLKNRVFVVLATLLVAMIPVIAVADVPQTCDARNRYVPGDLSTPCWPPEDKFEISIDSIKVEYVRTEGDVRDNLSEWHCRSSWFAEISVDKKPPEDAFFSVGGRGRLHLKHDYWSNEDTRFRFRLIPTHNSMDQAAAERGYTYTLADYYADENLSKGLGSYLHHFRWPEHGYIDFQPIWEMRADLYYSITHNGKEYKVPPHESEESFSFRVPRRTEMETGLSDCIQRLASDYERLKTISLEEEREAESRRVEELKEYKSANELAIAKEIETISARIDALRLRVAKQIDVNVVELNLVRERTTKAAIEIDREITAIEIDTKRKYMQSLEDTARWINEWVLEKQDQWDDLAELQSQWKQRITEYQSETAQVIQDLEAKRAEIESSIAESERRQRELEAQIRDSQIDTSQLEAQLEAAQAELKAAQERLEELED